MWFCPRSFKTLTFGPHFNQTLDNVVLPEGLQSLTLGIFCNQSLKEVVLPTPLQSLTFGLPVHFNLENVTLPNNLKSISLGSKYQIMSEDFSNFTLPHSLQSLSFEETSVSCLWFANGWSFSQHHESQKAVGTTARAGVTMNYLVVMLSDLPINLHCLALQYDDLKYE